MVRFQPLAPEKEKAILDRALKMIKADRLALAMDIEAANATCPLDPDRLLSFPDFDFFHDIFGIQSNIDRETGELQHCFLPRCAKH